MAMKYHPIVTGVAVVGEYRLRLLFDDGTVGDADFSSEKWVGIFEPLRDPAEFAKVRVDPEAGTIVWSNQLDWAPESLYAMVKAAPVSHVANAV
jgi:Protein of unknown function (DUF2442)